MLKRNSQNRLSLAAFLLLGTHCLWSQNPITVNVTGPIVQRPPAAGGIQNYLLTNGNNQGDQNLLNPGILFYGNGPYSWGADLGTNPGTGRYRTRLFASPTGDIAFSFTNNTPTSQSSFTDSVVIRGDSGNMGIGTPTPGAKLEVNGGITLTNGSHGVITFPDGSVQTTASTSGGGASSLPAITQVGQNVGIGTTQPAAALQVVGNVMIGHPAPDCNSPSGLLFYGGISNILLDCVQNLYLLSGLVINSNGQPVAQTGNPVGLYVQNDGFHFMADTSKAYGAVYNPSERLTISSYTGYVGIGTKTPGASLEVNGNVKLTAGTGASITYADGTVQSTAWNGVLTGGDYAESVDVSGDREEYEPGDVLVIDPTSEGKFLKSSAPYSTAVTGIYSTKPGVVGRRQLTARARMKEEVPMAMTGIVPTKVSAENGAIKPGDLLVTSSKPGYAMKGTDRTQMLGAVIGKAIGHLGTGEGVIEAVVTLQ